MISSVEIDIFIPVLLSFDRFLRSKECFKNNEVYLDCESKAFKLTLTLVYCIFVLLFKPTVCFFHGNVHFNLF